MPEGEMQTKTFKEAADKTEYRNREKFTTDKLGGEPQKKFYKGGLGR